MTCSASVFSESAGANAVESENKAAKSNSRRVDIPPPFWRRPYYGSPVVQRLTGGERHFANSRTSMTSAHGTLASTPGGRFPNHERPQGGVSSVGHAPLFPSGGE